MTRSLHWLDTPHLSIRGKRVRGIQNFCHFKTPDVDFAPSKPCATNIQSIPLNWTGNSCEFSFSSLEAPLQVFARDSTDPGNRALVGFRPSDSPQSWLNLKAVDVNAVELTISEDGKILTYPGLWPGCDLVYEVGRHKLKETVLIWDKNLAPSYFEWTLKTHPSQTVEITSNFLCLRDADGNIKVKSHAPWGRDSATTALTASGRQFIRCALTEEDPRQGLKVIRITPDPDSMAEAIGIVEIDPTIVISGAAAIEDTYVREFLPNNNFGAHSRTLVRIATGNDYHGLLRLNSTALPVADSYDALEFVPSIFSLGLLDLYVVVAANVWVQGTSVAANEPGAADYIDAQSGILGWAGGPNGCMVATTDRGTVSQGTIFLPGPSPLSTTPLVGWKASPATNNGWVVLSTGGGNSRWESIEGSPAPTFNLTYSETSVNPTFFFIGF